MQKNLGRGSVLLLILLVSCKTADFRGYDMREVKEGNHETVGTFQKKVRIYKYFGASGGPTLFNFKEDKVGSVTKQTILDVIERMEGDAAANISLDYGAGFVDHLINILTLGIVAPSVLTLQGDVVRYR